MAKNIAGILCNLILGFLTCPSLIIWITDIQGTAKGISYRIPEAERDIYALFGWMVLAAWMTVLICSEIAIFKFLFRKNWKLWGMGIGAWFFSMLAAFFLGVWR